MVHIQPTPRETRNEQTLLDRLRPYDGRGCACREMQEYWREKRTYEEAYRTSAALAESYLQQNGRADEGLVARLKDEMQRMLDATERRTTLGSDLLERGYIGAVSTCSGSGMTTEELMAHVIAVSAGKKPEYTLYCKGCLMEVPIDHHPNRRQDWFFGNTDRKEGLRFRAQQLPALDGISRRYLGYS